MQGIANNLAGGKGGHRGVSGEKDKQGTRKELEGF